MESVMKYIIFLVVFFGIIGLNILYSIEKINKKLAFYLISLFSLISIFLVIEKIINIDEIRQQAILVIMLFFVVIMYYFKLKIIEIVSVLGLSSCLIIIYDFLI